MKPGWLLVLFAATWLAADFLEADDPTWTGDRTRWGDGPAIEPPIPRIARPQPSGASRSSETDARVDSPPAMPSLPTDEMVAETRSADDLAESLQTAQTRLERVEKLLEEFTRKTDRVSYPTAKLEGRVHADLVNFLRDSPGIGFFENPTTGADPEDRVFFRRIRLGVGGQVTDNSEYMLQLDFNNPQRPELKDVFIGLTDLPVLQTLRVGHQKRPYGLDHLNSSNRNVLIERPLVVEAFNEDSRRTGICAYGVSDSQLVNWRYGAYVLENTRSTGSSVGDFQQFSLNGRIATTPIYDQDGTHVLHLGVSGMFGKPDGDPDAIGSSSNQARFRTRSEIRSLITWLDTGEIDGADAFYIVGLEFFYNHGPFQAVAEYLSNSVSRDPSVVGSGPNLHFQGAYGYVACMITGESMGFDRETGTIGGMKPYRPFQVAPGTPISQRGWGALQAVVRYDYLSLTDDNIQGGRAANWTAGLNWYFNSNTSLQLNAIQGRIWDREPVGGFSSGDFVGLHTRLRIFF